MRLRRSSEIQVMLQLVSTCKDLLRDGDVAGLEKTISLLGQKKTKGWKDKPDSGFTSYLIYGAHAGFKESRCSSWFLQETSEKAEERLLYLNHLNSEIDNLETAFFILKGIRHFHDGHYEPAFSVWENALRKVPSEKVIHRHISDILDQAGDTEKLKRVKEVAADLRRRYCFEEDAGFWERLETSIPGSAIRCIDFDDDGAIYLNCVNRHSIVKLNSDEAIEWEVHFEDSKDKGGMKSPRAFSSSCFAGDRLILCDPVNRQLVFIDKSGAIKQISSLPVDNPLFIHYVESSGQYHITDEVKGKVHILDERLRKIRSYQSPDDALRPVQVVFAKGANQMVLASSLFMLRSALEVFDMSGRYQRTITSFCESPCHVAKLDLDSCGSIYAVDHFGRIIKINAAGEIVWLYQESQRTDRFKYVKYHSPHLYLSDSLKLRRFRVDR